MTKFELFLLISLAILISIAVWGAFELKTEGGKCLQNSGQYFVDLNDLTCTCLPNSNNVNSFIISHDNNKTNH